MISVDQIYDALWCRVPDRLVDDDWHAACIASTSRWSEHRDFGLAVFDAEVFYDFFKHDSNHRLSTTPIVDTKPKPMNLSSYYYEDDSSKHKLLL